MISTCKKIDCKSIDCTMMTMKCATSFLLKKLLKPFNTSESAKKSCHFEKEIYKHILFNYLQIEVAVIIHNTKFHRCTPNLRYSFYANKVIIGFVKWMKLPVKKYINNQFKGMLRLSVNNVKMISLSDKITVKNIVYTSKKKTEM